MAKTKRVYLDHAAATPLDTHVLKDMLPFFSTHFANPEALYQEALIANGAFNDARSKIAAIMRTQPDSIIFTSSGTESNNLALQGIARANSKHGKHIVSLSIEHHAALHPLQVLEKEGFKVSYAPVNAEGIVRVEDIIKLIRPDTILVNVMYANNEVGTIEPIADIGRAILRYRKQHAVPYPYFHSDACQAANYLSLDVEKLHVDTMSICSSKLYGPKGAGALYIRRGVPLAPILQGGGQERGLRPGTQNVAGAIGLARALEISAANKERETARLRLLSSYFIREIKKFAPDVIWNGPEIGEFRLPNNVHVSFPRLEGEKLVIYLDAQGVMAATGSACTAQSSEASHVVVALGKSKFARQSVRFTLGRQTTRADIVYTLKALKKVLSLLDPK